MEQIHLHCVSDATGETVRAVARACLAQFEGVDATEHLWPLARTERAMERVLEDIAAHPGPVVFTIVDEPGPDVLMIGAALLDVVSRVPPQAATQPRVFIESVGEATLVLEIRGAMSNTIYARAERLEDLTGMDILSWNDLTELLLAIELSPNRQRPRH